MRCDEARAAVLEADPSVLEGLGEEPLARHLQECPACSARARAILEGEGALLRHLTATAPVLDPDRILAAAEARASEEALLPRRKSRWLARSQRGLTLLPLAAAAAAVAVFLAQPPALPGPTYTPPDGDAGLDVRAPVGAGVVVLETTDPTITVLWLF